MADDEHQRGKGDAARPVDLSEVRRERAANSADADAPLFDPDAEGVQRTHISITMPPMPEEAIKVEPTFSPVFAPNIAVVVPLGWWQFGLGVVAGAVLAVILG